MNHPRMKTMLLGLAIVLSLTAVVSTADAGWWGGRPVYAYSDCCVVSCCDPCAGYGAYLGWRPGPIRRAVLGPYRWYPAYWGGWGCYTSCCVPTCYTPSCCGVTYTTSCCGEVTGTVTTGPALAPAAPAPGSVPTPAPPKAPEAGAAAPVDAPKTMSTPVAPLSSPTVAPPPASGIPAIPATPAAPAAPAKPSSVLPGEVPAIPGATSYAPTQEDSALLTIWVPAEAKVTINGLATKSSGSRRQYVSYGLQAGYSYKYEVKAQIIRDGQVVEESRTISLTAGQRGAVAFGFNTRSAEGLAAN